MEKPALERDWREVPRAEMLEAVQVALEGYHAELVERDGEETRYAAYVYNQLLPFMESEQLRAEREAGYIK